MEDVKLKQLHLLNKYGMPVLNKSPLYEEELQMYRDDPQVVLFALLSITVHLGFKAISHPISKRFQYDFQIRFRSDFTVI